MTAGLEELIRFRLGAPERRPTSKSSLDDQISAKKVVSMRKRMGIVSPI